MQHPDESILYGSQGLSTAQTQDGQPGLDFQLQPQVDPQPQPRLDSHLKRRLDPQLDPRSRPRLDTQLQPQLDSQSRVPVDASSAHIHQLEADLLRTQMELGSLRNQLQPRETVIPAQAIDDFRQINKSVKVFCRTISESILSQKFADVDDPTTLQMVNPAQFAKAVGECDGAPSLMRSGNGQGRLLEDVFEYGLRSIINQGLRALIFSRFHPSLVGLEARGVSDGLKNVYAQMRKQSSFHFYLRNFHRSKHHSFLIITETQLISGMWRANTFSTLEGQMKPEEIDTLCLTFADRFSADLKLLKGPKDSGRGFVLSHDERQELEGIFHLAYKWNGRVNTGAIFVDFHPILLRNDARFDSSIMVPYDDVDMPEKSLRILCAVTLGLRSSDASKEGEEPLFAIQEKAQVLTGEYLGDPEEEVVCRTPLVIISSPTSFRR